MDNHNHNQDIEKIQQLSKKYKIRFSELETMSLMGDTVKEIEDYCKKRSFFKNLNISREEQSEIESLCHKIDLHTKSLKALHSIGWSYNSDIMTGLHNDRVMFISKIEQLSKNKLIVKFDKRDKVKLYDREKYLKMLEKTRKA